MNKLAVVLSALICNLMIATFALMPAFAQTTPEIAKGNCDSCANFSAKTLNYCVSKKGEYGKATLTNALKDCIGACKSTSDFIARGSKYQKDSAAITIKACNELIKACGGSGVSGDVQMKACADECRKCAGNLDKIVKGE